MRVFHGSNTKIERIDLAMSEYFYVQLATENTMLWQRPWEEIYAIFKKESHRAD